MCGRSKTAFYVVFRLDITHVEFRRLGQARFV